jgi:hypothetical protein
MVAEVIMPAGETARTTLAGVEMGGVAVTLGATIPIIITETAALTIHHPTTTGEMATMMPQAVTQEATSPITPATVPTSLHPPLVVMDGAAVAGEIARPRVLSAAPTMEEEVVDGTILPAFQAP